MADVSAQPDEVAASADGLRSRYVASLDALQQASDHLVGALREAREAREVARQLVVSGRPLGDLEEILDPQPLRASLADALADLERSRHHAQRLLFLLLQSEGQTLAEIGRTYGISRQLVSRLVNEPDPLHAG
jgi:DNA-directed RNA polymerase specialized sigma subunit